MTSKQIDYKVTDSGPIDGDRIFGRVIWIEHKEKTWKLAKNATREVIAMYGSSARDFCTQWNRAFLVEAIAGFYQALGVEA